MMSEMTKLEQYGEILGSIQDLCPTAHIAGGAVRDTIQGQPIKDIDLFLGAAALNDAAVLLRSKFGYVKVGEWAHYEMFSDPAVERVGRFERADQTIPVCLIGLHRPRDGFENVKRFDFGICMAHWSGRNITTSEQFDGDRSNKQFTLCRADNQSQFDYSMSRYHKLTADRYNGWGLVVRPEFAKLAKHHSFRRDYYSGYDNEGWHFRGPNRLTAKAR
jgi:hypothetical protein